MELSQPFALTLCQGIRVKLSVGRPLDPTAPEAPDAAERRRGRAFKIAEARRRSARPAAGALDAPVHQAGRIRDRVSPALNCQPDDCDLAEGKTRRSMGIRSLPDSSRMWLAISAACLTWSVMVTASVVTR